MNGKEIYKIWAPQGAKWTDWVRPVPFVAIDTYKRKETEDFLELKGIFLKEYLENTAIFVDLSGEKSIEFGIALAKVGYRPIPLFNGTNGPIETMETTDTYLVENALIAGTKKLKEININDNALPAFLLDSNRLLSYRSNVSIFDNSWDLYGQDIPSVNYFKDNGIKDIIVVGEKINSDLRRIFFKFQDKGINFFVTNGFNEPTKVKLRKTIKERLEKEDL